MKNTILLLSLVAFQFSSFCQNTVSGNLTNKKRNPLAFATIKLLNQDRDMLGATHSDSLGFFEIICSNCIQDSLQLEVTLYGFDSNYIPIYFNEKKQKISLDEIFMKKDSVLDAVVVFEKHKTIEKKIDRLVFNVDGSTSASGNTTLELLSRTPLPQLINMEYILNFDIQLCVILLLKKSLINQLRIMRL